MFGVLRPNGFPMVVLTCTDFFKASRPVRGVEVSDVEAVDPTRTPERRQGRSRRALHKELASCGDAWFQRVSLQPAMGCNCETAARCKMQLARLRETLQTLPAAARERAPVASLSHPSPSLCGGRPLPSLCAGGGRPQLTFCAWAFCPQGASESPAPRIHPKATIWL